MTGRRTASINSFVVGGTNSHAILESAPIIEQGKNRGCIDIDTLDSTTLEVNGVNRVNGVHEVNGVSGVHTNGTDGIKEVNGTSKTTARSKTGNVETPRKFTVTAKSEKALLSTLRKLGGWVSNRKEDGWLAELAYTLPSHRSILQWRWSGVAATHQDLGHLMSREQQQITQSSHDCQIMFLFTGQGAQWAGLETEVRLFKNVYFFVLSNSPRSILSALLSLICVTRVSV